MNIVEALQTEINSGMLTVENHCRDNGFFGDTLKECEKELKRRKYEPVGICKNVPFECAYSSYVIAFVFRYNEEIYWCHLPESYWFKLLKEVYGHLHADIIIQNILGKE